MQLAAVVLAAGKGTRMKSSLPKVLHKICGRPILHYVLETVKAAGIEKIVVVVGHQGDLVAEALAGQAGVVYQHPQLGTAHALLQAGDVLAGFTGQILVVGGDTPLVTPATILQLLEVHRASRARATVLTASLPDPAGYGRVIREGRGKVIRIVEHKDAAPEELAIREINTGIYCFSGEGLFTALTEIKTENVQKEYYLTDLIEKYVKAGLPVAACEVRDAEEILGINDRCQMAEVEAILRRRILNELMFSGVTVVDPSSTFVDPEVVIGQDSIIYPFTIIEGKSAVGPNCRIGPGVRLVDAQVGEGVAIANSVVLESKIGDCCTIGPFAYIRPGCILEQNVKVGDFVEIKKATIGKGSKVPHLSYIGDATIGSDVNVGAGTITCNYDGMYKWHTRIGDGAFIGSNTNLVAPVEVGVGAVVAAGSTLTRDVPAGALGVARSRQRNIEGYSKRRKIVAKEDSKDG